MKIGITEKGDASFNYKWVQWVKAGKPAILISKDPLRLFTFVERHVGFNANIIVHCTITGNGGTIMEPNVPDYKTSLEGYKKFVDKFGEDRVVLRIDPIIPIEPYLSNSLKVWEEAGKPKRVRISFMDNYNHVKERMKKLGMQEFDYTFNAPLKLRQQIWEKMEKPSICGEKDMQVTACISEIDCKILGVTPNTSKAGQRSACGCLSNKFELLDAPQQCSHKCVYCYWQKEENPGLF